MFPPGAEVMLSNVIKCFVGLEPNCLPRCRTDLWHGTNMSVLYSSVFCIFCFQSSNAQVFGGFVVDYTGALWQAGEIICDVSVNKCQLIFVLLPPVPLVSNLQFSWEGEGSPGVAEFGSSHWMRFTWGWLKAIK